MSGRTCLVRRLTVRRVPQLLRLFPPLSPSHQRLGLWHRHRTFRGLAVRELLAVDAARGDKREEGKRPLP